QVGGSVASGGPCVGERLGLAPPPANSPSKEALTVRRPTKPPKRRAAHLQSGGPGGHLLGPHQRIAASGTTPRVRIRVVHDALHTSRCAVDLPSRTSSTWRGNHGASWPRQFLRRRGGTPGSGYGGRDHDAGRSGDAGAASVGSGRTQAVPLLAHRATGCAGDHRTPHGAVRGDHGGGTGRRW